MTTNQSARATVERYLDLVATGTAEEIVDLFADDATLEDPVGGEVLRGKEAIAGFYAGVAPLEMSTRLITIRTCGGQAAFHFETRTKVGEQTYAMEPIEVMTFDTDGQITSMRAWWSDEDMRVE